MKNSVGDVAVISPGSMSRIVTFSAVPGPLFVTLIINSVSSPYRG